MTCLLSAAHVPGVSALGAGRRHGSLPCGPPQRATEWPHSVKAASFPQSAGSKRASKAEAQCLERPSLGSPARSIRGVRGPHTGPTPRGGGGWGHLGGRLAHLPHHFPDEVYPGSHSWAETGTDFWCSRASVSGGSLVGRWRQMGVPCRTVGVSGACDGLRARLKEWVLIKLHIG